MKDADERAHPSSFLLYPSPVYLRFIYILWLSVILLTLGCGRAGPPTIPGPVAPTPVSDLTGIAKGGAIQLEWTLPTRDTKGREIHNIKTLEVYRREIPPFPPWEFSEDPEGWTPKESLAPLKVHEGVLRTILPTGDTAFMVSREGKPLIDASTIKYVKIRLRARNSLAGYFLFITESDKSWDLDLGKTYTPGVYTSYAAYASDLATLKRKRFAVIDDGYFHEYTLDMSTVPSWAGSIAQVGLLLTYSPQPGFVGDTEAEPRPSPPPGEGGREIEIDYIRTSSGEEPQATKYEQYPWLFIEDEEGWSVQGWNPGGTSLASSALSLSPSSAPPLPIFGAARGFLYAESQSGSIFLTSRAGIALDPGEFNQIEIRMKVSRGGEGYLLFQTEADPQWDLNLQDKYIPAVYTSYAGYSSNLGTPKWVRFSIPEQDASVTYRFNMFMLPSWTGKITRLGLFFPALQGERRVLIDSIQVSYRAPTPLAQGVTAEDNSKNLGARQDGKSQEDLKNSDAKPDEKPSEDHQKPDSTRQVRTMGYPKYVAEVSPSARDGQEPTDQEIREVVLVKHPVSQEAFVPYEALPPSPERSFDPIKLAVIHLKDPEPARVEENRVMFTDTGQLVNVDPKDLIKETVGDLQGRLPPEISLKPWAKYEYYVLSALDKRKRSDKSNLITVQASKDPAPPPHVEAKADDEKVLLRWQPAFLTVDGVKLRSLAGYNVYRTTEPGEYPDSPINPTILTSTQLTDTGLKNGQTYYYVVRAVSETGPGPTARVAAGRTPSSGEKAVNAAGLRLHESANSEEVKATPVDLIPPALPTGLKGTFLEDSVRLYWNPNSEKDFIGYNIYRSTQKEGGYVRLNEQPVLQASYRDFKVEPNKIYYYKITALDDASPPNESKASNIVEIDTSPEE